VNTPTPEATNGFLSNRSVKHHLSGITPGRYQRVSSLPSLLSPLFLSFFFICLSATAFADIATLQSLQLQAFSTAKEELEALWNNRENPERTEAGLYLLDKFLEKKQYQETLSLAWQILDEPEQPASVQGKALLSVLKVMKHTDQRREQEKAFRLLRQLAPKLASNTLKHKLWHTAAVIKHNQTPFLDAILYFQKTLSVAPADPQIQVDDLIGLSASQAQAGKYTQALESMLKAQQSVEENNLKVQVGLLKNLGALNFVLKYPQRSIDYTSKAIQAASPTSAVLPSLYANLSAAYSELGNEEQAYASAFKAWDMSRKLGKPYASAANNLGYLLSQRGQYKEAIKLFEEAEALYSANNRHGLVGVTQKNIGETWIKLGDRKKAAVYLQKSYDIYKPYDFESKKRELYPVMIENLKQLGNFKQALTIMEEYKVLNDKINSLKLRKQVAELQSDIQLKEKERELALAKKDKLVATQTMQQMAINEQKDRIINYILWSLLILLAVVALILRRLNKLQANINLTLQNKNQHIKKQHSILKTTAEELKVLSTEDSLTKLKNRRYLEKLITDEASGIHRQIEQGDSPEMLLIFIDIDNFKAVNDKFGHSAGDQALIKLADILRHCARSSDILARWGGEEFCWFCRDSGVAEGAALCARVRDQLHHTSIDINGNEIHITCSFGIAPYPLSDDPIADWDATLKIADTALYEAKHNGKDCWVGYQLKPGQTDTAIDLENLKSSPHLIRFTGP
jgi:diguanylate cyclase (GGDEF)-like protein